MVFEKLLNDIVEIIYSLYNFLYSHKIVHEKCVFAITDPVGSIFLLGDEHA